MTVTGFENALVEHRLAPLRRRACTTVQLNATKRCNLACHHCHVESSPKRSEDIGEKTALRLIELLDRSPGVECLDLTGGAPEMSQQFRPLVRAARARGLEVIDRCNLTIFFEPGYEDLPEFLAAHDVRIVASLPCYTKENVDGQRGRHVFDGSIEALRWLNRLGYGTGKRPLDLVYNPTGPALPPDQTALESEYRSALRDDFGIEFDRLLTIANMPIKRWADWLTRRGEYERYLSLLVNHFNPETVPRVMCLDLVSVGYDGRLYDCDFNQQLELPLRVATRTLFDLESFGELDGAPIATREHCFGCTAGSGSSCGGALS